MHALTRGQQLLVSTADFYTINAILKDPANRSLFSLQEAEELQKELKRATIIEPEAMPRDVVTLYSTVTLVEEGSMQLRNFTIVPPGKADISRMRISVCSPLGAAVLGYAKGSNVTWRVPAGIKTFRIVEVTSPLT